MNTAVEGSRLKVQGNRLEPRTSNLEPRWGQAAIELVLALIGTMLLFVGTAIVWSWLVGAMVARQRAYENTRVTAATPSRFSGPMRAREFQFVPKPMNVWGDKRQ